MNRDCSNLSAGDRVCIDGQQLGAVVKVFARYVEAQPVVGLIFVGRKRKYSRRDGFEWGGSSSFGHRSCITPWDEEKDAPRIAQYSLEKARRNIGLIVGKHSPTLSLNQINKIRSVLNEAEGA
jgi:hypothetical protein